MMSSVRGQCSRLGPLSRRRRRRRRRWSFEEERPHGDVDPRLSALFECSSAMLGSAELGRPVGVLLQVAVADGLADLGDRGEEVGVRHGARRLELVSVRDQLAVHVRACVGGSSRRALGSHDVDGKMGEVAVTRRSSSSGRLVRLPSAHEKKVPQSKEAAVPSKKGRRPSRLRHQSRRCRGVPNKRPLARAASMRRRTLIMAASRHTLATSAPEYPSVLAASSSRSTSSATSTSRIDSLKSASRPAADGSGM
mmetsp:Transcript_10322/g.41776  ORF Transcript_10322/g.41776 Transcript_10322/m.41776 type:complete len:252 (-) Transcript_10322:1427-2182(-)